MLYCPVMKKNTPTSPEQRPYQTLASRVTWSCPWYSVRQDDIITPDGQRGVYNTVTKPNAVWIVPVTAVGDIVLIHTYRYTVDDWCWEIPAGGVKAGQTAEEAAAAELREEIGGTAVHWQRLHQFYICNGFCDEVGTIFLATGVTLNQPTAHEPTEIMTIHTMPAAAALRMARAGEISDAPSVLALLLCEPLLTPAHKPGTE